MSFAVFAQRFGNFVQSVRNEVADFFEPSIEAAVASIRAQIAASGGLIKVDDITCSREAYLTSGQSVWLVGGFAASPWLFSQLQERLAPLNVTINRPDTQTLVAVSRCACLSDFKETVPRLLRTGQLDSSVVIAPLKSPLSH